MKKILLASLLLVAGASAQAANQTVPLPGNATASSSTTVPAATCTLLASDTPVNISANNVGSVDCDTGTANIGVAIGNNGGKGVIYTAGSVGGGVTATPGQTLPFTTGGVPQTQARAQSARTS